MLVVVLVTASLLLADYASSRIIWRSKAPSVQTYAANGPCTCVVFPGFSNPAEPFGQGMQRVLESYGPILLVRYGTAMRFEPIYRAILMALERLGPNQHLVLYGHSMGGQFGEMFRQRYEKEGSPYGSIDPLILDCSPSTSRSLGSSSLQVKAAQLLLKFYWGGPLLSPVVALFNFYSRLTMPAPLAPEVDPLYGRYARGLMWYNTRAWVAQMKFMLQHQLPPRQTTTTRVIYIGAADPPRDKLVNQTVAKREWREVHPTWRSSPTRTSGMPGRWSSPPPTGVSSSKFWVPHSKGRKASSFWAGKPPAQEDDAQNILITDTIKIIMTKQAAHTAKLVLNRRARFDYDIREEFKVGIVLNGSEVRAIRDGRASLRGAYVTIKNGELWLTNASFTIRQQGSMDPVVDTRPRKLLASKKEIAHIVAAKDSGLTVVPLNMTTNTRYIKLTIATAKGKKSYDKRETIKRRDTEREAQRAIKRV